MAQYSPTDDTDKPKTKIDAYGNEVSDTSTDAYDNTTEDAANPDKSTDTKVKVLNFPNIRNMMNSMQLVKDSDIASNPTVAAGRQGIQNLYQKVGMSPEQAQKEQMAGEDLSRQAGMIAGTLGDVGNGVQELPGTGGADSVMEAQNAAKQIGQSPGGAASQQIIGAEAQRHLALMRQMAAKNAAKWGGQ